MNTITSEAASIEDNPIVKAADVFWREGYDGASMEDIVVATGMNRYGLYAKFGGKRDLFLLALEHYHAEGRARLEALLSDPETRPLEAIRLFMKGILGEMDSRGGGCLMCAAVQEGAPKDEVIAQRVRDYVSEFRGAFSAILSRARGAGELSDSVTPEAGALLLDATLFGVGVQSRAGVALESLFKTIDAAIAAVSSPKAIASSGD